jgi:hypothetical protein
VNSSCSSKQSPACSAHWTQSNGKQTSVHTSMQSLFPESSQTPISNVQKGSIEKAAMGFKVLSRPEPSIKTDGLCSSSATQSSIDSERTPKLTYRKGSSGGGDFVASPVVMPPQRLVVEGPAAIRTAHSNPGFTQRREADQPDLEGFASEVEQDESTGSQTPRRRGSGPVGFGFNVLRRNSSVLGKTYRINQMMIVLSSRRDFFCRTFYRSRVYGFLTHRRH